MMPREVRIFNPIDKYYNDDGSEMSEEQKTLYLKEKEENDRKREEEYQKREEEYQKRISIKGQIEDLRKEIALKDQELINLINLEKLYPDVRKYQAKYRAFQQSKSVNNKVTDFEYKYSCGCCSDAAVMVFPYLETKCGKVYSDPCSFTIGERYQMPHGSWKKSLVNAGISDTVICMIEKQLKAICMVEEDEEDGE